MNHWFHSFSHIFICLSSINPNHNTEPAKSCQKSPGQYSENFTIDLRSMTYRSKLASKQILISVTKIHSEFYTKAQN